MHSILRRPQLRCNRRPRPSCWLIFVRFALVEPPGGQALSSRRSPSGGVCVVMSCRNTKVLGACMNFKPCSRVCNLQTEKSSGLVRLIAVQLQGGTGYKCTRTKWENASRPCAPSSDLGPADGRVATTIAVPSAPSSCFFASARNTSSRFQAADDYLHPHHLWRQACAHCPQERRAPPQDRRGRVYCVVYCIRCITCIRCIAVYAVYDAGEPGQ